MTATRPRATVTEVRPTGFTVNPNYDYFDCEGKWYQYRVTYTADGHLFDLTLTARSDEGLLKQIERAVRSDYEARRYTEDPLDAVRDRFPYEMEL